MRSVFLFLASLCLVSVAFAADLTSPPLLTTQPSQSQPDTQPQTQPILSLPLDRTSYVVGEDIPLGVVSPNPKIHLTVLDPFARKIDLFNGSPGPLRFNTAALAPGEYRLFIDDVPVNRIVLVSSLRRSGAIFSDETLPPGVIYMPNDILDPDLRAKADQAWHDNVVKTMKETGINVCFDMGDSDPGRLKINDTLLESQTLVFNNPYTRPLSFFPARVYQPEVQAFRQKLALTAQANARYPNFGGFLLEWDPTGFLTRQSLFTYWNWGDSDADLKDYVARSDQALYDDFQKKTGFKPVTPDEYLTYTLGLGRLDFAPAIDLPTRRWLDEIALKLPKPVPAKSAELQNRVDAWSDYLMGLYEVEHNADAAVIKSIEPSLQISGSINLDHNAVKDGQYTPSAYRGLDFRYMSAWNDQVAGPDYDYQWLLSAAMMNIERHGEPMWVGTSMSFVHDISPYPGKLMRVIAHCFSQGATGVGFTLEGSSDPLGGQDANANWAQIKGTDKAEELRTGRDFADRFAFLAKCHISHSVAILYSKTQMKRQYLAQGMLTPQWLAIMTLTRLGYMPRLVSEDEIATGILEKENFKGLVILQQTFALPDSVTKKIEAFAKAGGIVAIDKSTTISLAGAKVMDYEFPRKDIGRPFAWNTPNYVQGDSHMRLAQEAFDAFATPVDNVLAGAGRTCYVSDKGVHTQTAVMQFDDDEDLKYLVVTNESFVSSQGDWHQVHEKLICNVNPFENRKSRLANPGAIYDLTDEKQIGIPGDPIECDLTKTSVRVYALVSGRMNYERNPHHHLLVSHLFHLDLHLPDGGLFSSCYDPPLEYSVPVNLPDKSHLVVHSQLDGNTFDFPTKTDNVIIFTGDPVTQPDPPRVVPVADLVIDDVGDQLRKAFWKGEKGRKFIIPVFNSPHQAALLKIAELLKAILSAKGMQVDILTDPPRCTYTVAYKPTPEQEKENQRATNGQAIGKIAFETVNRNDYASGLGGYVFGGADVILLDLPGQHVNELAEHLDAAGLVWPHLTPGFPGPGRAIVREVASAFDPVHSAIVIQAENEAGLDVAVQNLDQLPTRWIRMSVEEARQRMGGVLRTAESPTDSYPYIPNNRGVLTPEPLTINFGKTPPPPPESEVKPLIRPIHKPVFTPATFRTGDLIPQIRTVAGTFQVPSLPNPAPPSFEDAWSPGGSWLGDTRYADAYLFVLNIDKAAPTLIQFDGVFRYPDKRPKSQPQWDDILAFRDKFVPLKPDGMSIDVLIDGHPAGTINQLDEDLRWIETSMVPDPVTKLRPTLKEPVVVRISGKINLPEGIHSILLVPHRIVDGQIDGVYFGVNKPLLQPMK